MNTSLVTKAAGGVAILGGTGAGGTYLATKDSIWNQVKDVCLPSNLDDNDAWLATKRKLVSSTEELPEIFRTLKTELIKNNNETAGVANTMKNECKKIYDLSLNIFNKEEDLVKATKKICSVTIGEKLKGKIITVDSVWATAQEKKIKTVSETDKAGLLKEFKDLNKALNTTGAQTPNPDNRLKEACKKIWDRIYTGSTNNQNEVDQVSKYCSYTIEEKLKEDASVNDSKLYISTGEEDKTTIEGKIGDNVESNANDFFKKLKGKKTEWTKWRDECQRLYKLQWDGQTESVEGNYKLAHTYCKKS